MRRSGGGGEGENAGETCWTGCLAVERFGPGWYESKIGGRPGSAGLVLGRGWGAQCCSEERAWSWGQI